MLDIKGCVRNFVTEVTGYTRSKVTKGPKVPSERSLPLPNYHFFSPQFWQKVVTSPLQEKDLSKLLPFLSRAPSGSPLGSEIGSASVFLFWEREINLDFTTDSK